MKLLFKTILTLISATVMCFAATSHDKYIIFGDSLSDSGSKLSSEILKKQTSPQHAMREISYNGKEFVKDLGNNYWVLGDLIAKP
jgi:hypothetical protein